MTGAVRPPPPRRPARWGRSYLVASDAFAVEHEAEIKTLVRRSGPELTGARKWGFAGRDRRIPPSDLPRRRPRCTHLPLPMAAPGAPPPAPTCARGLSGHRRGRGTGCAGAGADGGGSASGLRARRVLWANRVASRWGACSRSSSGRCGGVLCGTRCSSPPSARRHRRADGQRAGDLAAFLAAGAGACTRCGGPGRSSSCPRSSWRRAGSCFASRGGLANHGSALSFVPDLVFNPWGLAVVMSLKSFPFPYLTSLRSTAMADGGLRACRPAERRGPAAGCC